MRECKSKVELKNELITLLEQDDRTLGIMTLLPPMLHIVEGLPHDQVNWSVSVEGFIAKPLIVQDAIKEAEFSLQQRWQLDLSPLATQWA